MIVVNTTVGQNLELSAPLPNFDNARLRDGPVSVIAFAVSVMPIGGVSGLRNVFNALTQSCSGFQERRNGPFARN
jgi:hypothetical protein